MSPPSGADEVSSCYSSRRRTITLRLSTIAGACPEEEEEDDYADDAGSQVTFDKEWL